MKHMIQTNEQTIGQTEVWMDNSWSPPHVLHQNDRRVLTRNATMPLVNADRYSHKAEWRRPRWRKIRIHYQH